jgi:peroxiredoxin
MATIIVISKQTPEQDSAVVFEEKVEPEHMASKHHAAQLLERLGWAVSDARNVEDRRASAVSR